MSLPNFTEYVAIVESKNIIKSDNFDAKDIKRASKRDEEIIYFWIKVSDKTQYDKVKIILKNALGKSMKEYDKSVAYIGVDEDDVIMYYSLPEYKNFLKETNTKFEVFSFDNSQRVSPSAISISSLVGYTVFKLDNLYLKEDFEELIPKEYKKYQKEIITFLSELFKNKKNYRYYIDPLDKDLFFFTNAEGKEAYEKKSGLSGFSKNLFYRKR